MPPRKKSTPGPPPLTDAEVAALGSRLKAGEKPRVIVRSASAAVPAGTRGNIIRLGNPKDGDYVVVRLGRDEVPFAPAELSLSTRGAAKTSSAPPAPVQKRIAAATSRPARSATRSTAKATKSSPARAAKSTPAAARPAATQKATPAVPAAPAKSTATRAGAAAGAGRSTKRAARRGKGRSPQPLTVTLRFSDSRWTVEAQRGSRRITKAMPLRPGAVSAFAEHVDEQVVREALVETVESCRAVVEERAALLRAELQAAESSLREYDARRR